MPDSIDPPASETLPTGCASAAQDSLTDAQRAFTRLLGRLLAQLWQEEQQAQHVTPPSEKQSDRRTLP
jgi:hypothetical protein